MLSVNPRVAASRLRSRSRSDMPRGARSAAMADKKQKKLRGTARHEATHADPTGLGAETAKRQRKARELRSWDLSAEVSKWSPRPVGIVKSLDEPSDAAALELESAKALRALRRKFEELCSRTSPKECVRSPWSGG